MKKILYSLAFVLIALCSAQAEKMMALTSANRLLVFDSAAPQTATQTLAVTGLAAGETLVGIDFRPFSGGLYGLSSNSRIYLIDANTGVATAIGAAGAFTLQGTSFGFDFNPLPDRIRITSNANQNLRVNPNNGALGATDGTLAYAPGDPNAGTDPNIVGSAYTNSFSGAQATTLYNIDSNLNILVRQEPPNAGTLNTVGPLGTDTTDAVGFDISPTTGIAYAFLTAPQLIPASDGAIVEPRTGLYTINLNTGEATFVGPVADTIRLNDEVIVGLAIPGTTRLLNISTRGRVGQGEDVLIGGLILRGGDNARVLIRGIGPSITGVNAPLQDPVLTLFDADRTVVATNDNWQQAPNAAEITANGAAPTNPAEAAILVDLPPGSYTAQVTGKDGAGGVALVEIFQQP